MNPFFLARDNCLFLEWKSLASSLTNQGLSLFLVPNFLKGARLLANNKTNKKTKVSLTDGNSVFRSQFIPAQSYIKACTKKRCLKQRLNTVRPLD